MFKEIIRVTDNVLDYYINEFEKFQVQYYGDNAYIVYLDDYNHYESFTFKVDEALGGD